MAIDSEVDRTLDEILDEIEEAEVDWEASLTNDCLLEKEAGSTVEPDDSTSIVAVSSVTESIVVDSIVNRSTVTESSLSTLTSIDAAPTSSRRVESKLQACARDIIVSSLMNQVLRKVVAEGEAEFVVMTTKKKTTATSQTTAASVSSVATESVAPSSSAMEISKTNTAVATTTPSSSVAQSSPTSTATNEGVDSNEDVGMLSDVDSDNTVPASKEFEKEETENCDDTIPARMEDFLSYGCEGEREEKTAVTSVSSTTTFSSSSSTFTFATIPTSSSYCASSSTVSSAPSQTSSSSTLSSVPLQLLLPSIVIPRHSAGETSGIPVILTPTRVSGGGVLITPNSGVYSAPSGIGVRKTSQTKPAQKKIKINADGLDSKNAFVLNQKNDANDDDRDSDDDEDNDVDFCDVNTTNTKRGKRNAKPIPRSRTKIRNNNDTKIDRKNSGAEKRRQNHAFDDSSRLVSNRQKDGEASEVCLGSRRQLSQQQQRSRTPSPNCHWLDPTTRTYHSAIAVVENPQFQPKILLSPMKKQPTSSSSVECDGNNYSSTGVLNCIGENMRKSLPARAESGLGEKE